VIYLLRLPDQNSVCVFIFHYCVAYPTTSPS